MVWVLITLKQYPLFSRLWIHQAFFYDMKETLGMRFKNYKSLFSGTYAESKELEKLKKLLITKLEKDLSSIWILCRDWKKDCDKLIEATQNLEKDNLSKYSDKELINLMEEITKKFRRSASFIYLSIMLDEYFHDWLNGILNKRITDTQKRINYFQILCSPIKNTKLLEAKNDLRAIVEMIKKKDSRGANDLIKKYTLKFRWLRYDTGIGKDLTIEDTKSKVSSILKQKEVKPISKNRASIIKELNLANADKKLLDLMSELIYLRTYRAESNMIAGYNMRPVIEELAKRFNTTYDNVVQLTLDEIKSAITSKKIDLAEIQRRKNKYGLLMINGKNKIYSGDSVDKIEEKVDIPKGIFELKGLVANRGKIKAPVKIVLNRKDFDKIKFGDILVTKMTNPDFMVVLEKCSGIITDIGGITSHAAIIARELNKPCVIGTVYATKVLKDGEIVELDANRGIVKKIK